MYDTGDAFWKTIGFDWILVDSVVGGCGLQSCRLNTPGRVCPLVGVPPRRRSRCCSRERTAGPSWGVLWVSKVSWGAHGGQGDVTLVGSADLRPSCSQSEGTESPPEKEGRAHKTKRDDEAGGA